MLAKIHANIQTIDVTPTQILHFMIYKLSKTRCKLLKTVFRMRLKIVDLRCEMSGDGDHNVCVCCGDFIKRRELHYAVLVKIFTSAGIIIDNCNWCQNNLWMRNNPNRYKFQGNDVDIKPMPNQVMKFIIVDLIDECDHLETFVMYLEFYLDMLTKN